MWPAEQLSTSREHIEDGNFGMVAIARMNVNEYTLNGPGNIPSSEIALSEQVRHLEIESVRRR